MKTLIHSCLLTLTLALIAANSEAQIPPPQLAKATGPSIQSSADDARGTPAGLFDDFESYTPGQSLVDQSDWFNVVDTGDTVVSSGIDGQSGAHISDGSESFGQVLGRRVSTGQFGTLTVEVRPNLNTSNVSLIVGSESDFLNASIGFYPSQNVWVFQDFDETDEFINLVPTGVDWVENQTVDVSFTTTIDGKLSIYYDGRLIFAGKDMSDKNGSGASPVDFLGVRASNSEAGDSVEIDNISDALSTANDPAGSADLYHSIGAGTLEPYDKIISDENTFLGQTFKVTTLTYNTDDSETSADVAAEVTIPSQLSLIDDTCNGTVSSGVYMSETFTLAAKQWKACTLELEVAVSIDDVEPFLVLETEATATTPDAFLSNNSSVFFINPLDIEIFKDRFQD